ncbi:MAG: hypothetical protein K2J00_00770 [Bacteroidaceae bacterium]|nr:hypothetical protein [Bacteroidaceae bacterium]
MSKNALLPAAIDGRTRKDAPRAAGAFLLLKMLVKNTMRHLYLRVAWRGNTAELAAVEM